MRYRGTLLALVTPAVVLGAACGEAPSAPSHLRIESLFRIPLVGRGEASPTLCDLDADGDLELLLARQPVESAIDDAILTAFDATTGQWLWTGPAQTQAYGSVACTHTAAGDDVYVTGRWGELARLDGRTGAVLWRLTESNPLLIPAAVPETFVSTPIVDVESGLAATTFSGDASASVVARFVVFDPSGAIVAMHEAPEGAGSFASPALDVGDDGTRTYAFATGGETNGGTVELLRFTAPDTLTPIGAAPSNCTTGGYVASPLFADVDGDGARELVAADYCGYVVVVERDGALRFATKVHDYHATANPVAADVDADEVLDVVAVFSEFNPTHPPGGASPSSTVIALSGTDGHVLWTRTVPGFVVASPAVVDLDHDDREDVLVVGMSFQASLTPSIVVGGTRALSGRDGHDLLVMDGIGSGATPLLDDVDHDGQWDLFVFDVPATNSRSGSLFRFALEGTRSDVGAFSGFRGHPAMIGAR